MSGPKHLLMKISRSKFDSFGDLFERTNYKTPYPMQTFLANIDEVILVGGQTEHLRSSRLFRIISEKSLTVR
jgi:hypothetical protein